MVFLAQFGGDSADEAQQKAENASRELRATGFKTRVTEDAQEMKKYWVIRRESFNLLRHRMKGKHTAPFIDDIVVRPELLPKFLPKLRDLLAPYNLEYSIAGHVGSGNFHIIPLVKKGDESFKGIIGELSEKVYTLVLEFSGSITAEHNDGLIRSPYLPMMYGDQVCGLFAHTKRIFDPDNIFNPGKKVGASREFALKHIAI